jgi:hypothetical protein
MLLGSFYLDILQHDLLLVALKLKLEQHLELLVVHGLIL